VYTTLALICIELLSEETVLDFIRLILSIQELAITNAVLSTQQKFHLHGLVISIMLFVAIVIDLHPLKDYVEKVKYKINKTLNLCIVRNINENCFSGN